MPPVVPKFNSVKFGKKNLRHEDVCLWKNLGDEKLKLGKSV